MHPARSGERVPRRRDYRLRRSCKPLQPGAEAYLKQVLSQRIADGSRPGLDLNLPPIDLTAIPTATLSASR